MQTSLLNTLTRSSIYRSDLDYIQISSGVNETLISMFPILISMIQDLLDSRTLNTVLLRSIISRFLDLFPTNLSQTKIIDIGDAVIAFLLKNLIIDSSFVDLFETLEDIPQLEIENVWIGIDSWDEECHIRPFISHTPQYYVFIEPITSQYFIKYLQFNIPAFTRAGSCFVLKDIEPDYICYPQSYFPITSEDCEDYVDSLDEIEHLDDDWLLRNCHKHTYLLDNLKKLSDKFDASIKWQLPFNRRKHLIAYYYKH